MRTLTSAAQAQLDQNCGTEPVVIVEVQWVPGGGRCRYADRKVADSVLGQLVQIDNIDSTVTTNGSVNSTVGENVPMAGSGFATGSTDSTQVHLVLDDTGGAIKRIFDTHDLVKRDVWVYQWFEGLSLDDKFLLFKGEINTPVEWNEGDRTVSFDVITRIEDVEAGFSMEEGDFPRIPPDALGKEWPLVFGSVCDVKATQVRSPRYGILQAGEGIHDYTLESRICQAKYIQCANTPTGTATAVTNTTQAGTTGGLTPAPGSKSTLVSSLQTQQVQTWAPDQSCIEDRYFIICDLIYQLEQQKTYEHSTMTVLGATTLFPQGEKITLVTEEGAKFTGQFSGDVFTIAAREHPDFSVNPPGVCRYIDDRSFQVVESVDACNWTATASGSAWYAGYDITANPQEIQNYCDTQVQSCLKQQSVGGPVDSRTAYDNMPTSSFFWARAGTKVYLESDAEVLYIINLLPCTITRVAAVKQTNLGPKLMTVPADWYTIHETDYGGYTVTEISMPKLLSQRSTVVADPNVNPTFDSNGNPIITHHVEPSKWSDDLYVTLTSSVGPNPADIIAWLIGKYTDLGIDSASFDHVRTRLTNYPAAFALQARKNVMELIADIAVQSRCVFSVRDDVVYLFYASEEPTSVATIGVSDVLVNTLKIGLSSTDDLATKHMVTWTNSYFESQVQGQIGGANGPMKLILKNNVAKYGTQEKDWDYYTLNIFDNVLKSVTFWAIRDANVWKIVEFSTPLKRLALEVFDCVTLDLPGIASVPVKALVTAAKYDVTNQQITFTCWTPVRAGEMMPYVHAWPALIPAGTIFPTAEERAEGLGYNFVVSPPDGHLLYYYVEPDGNPPAVLTSGDPHPSDLDDVLETCFCPTTDDAYVDEPDPVFQALKRANQAANSATAAKMNAGAGGKNDQKEKKGRACGEQEFGGGCLYEVQVGYITPLTTNDGCSKACPGGGLGTCGPGCTGLVCTSTANTFCHTFGALFAAQAFADQMRQQIKAHLVNCGGGPVIWGTYGQTFPSTVSGPTAIPDPKPGAEPCEKPPGDQNKMPQGETYKPTQQVWTPELAGSSQPQSIVNPYASSAWDTGDITLVPGTDMSPGGNGPATITNPYSDTTTPPQCSSGGCSMQWFGTGGQLIVNPYANP